MNSSNGCGRSVGGVCGNGTDMGDITALTYNLNLASKVKQTNVHQTNVEGKMEFVVV